MSDTIGLFNQLADHLEANGIDQKTPLKIGIQKSVLMGTHLVGHIIKDHTIEEQFSKNDFKKNETKLYRTNNFALNKAIHIQNKKRVDINFARFSEKKPVTLADIRVLAQEELKAALNPANFTYDTLNNIQAAFKKGVDGKPYTDEAKIAYFQQAAEKAPTEMQGYLKDLVIRSKDYVSPQTLLRGTEDEIQEQKMQYVYECLGQGRADLGKDILKYINISFSLKSSESKNQNSINNYIQNYLNEKDPNIINAYQIILNPVETNAEHLEQAYKIIGEKFKGDINLGKTIATGNKNIYEALEKTFESQTVNAKSLIDPASILAFETNSNIKRGHNPTQLDKSLKILYKRLTYPTRFIGSKTDSFPTQIARGLKKVYKEKFSKNELRINNPITTDDSTPSEIANSKTGYSNFKPKKQLDEQSARAVLPQMAACMYAYTQDPTYLSHESLDVYDDIYQVDKETFPTEAKYSLINDPTIKMPEGTYLEKRANGVYINQNNGLRLFISRPHDSENNPIDNKVVIAFSCVSGYKINPDEASLETFVKNLDPKGIPFVSRPPKDQVKLLKYYKDHKNSAPEAFYRKKISPEPTSEYIALSKNICDFFGGSESHIDDLDTSSIISRNYLIGLDAYGTLNAMSPISSYGNNLRDKIDSEKRMYIAEDLIKKISDLTESSAYIKPLRDQLIERYKIIDQLIERYDIPPNNVSDLMIMNALKAKIREDTSIESFLRTCTRAANEKTLADAYKLPVFTHQMLMQSLPKFLKNDTFLQPPIKDTPADPDSKYAQFTALQEAANIQTTAVLQAGSTNPDITPNEKALISDWATHESQDTFASKAFGALQQTTAQNQLLGDKTPLACKEAAALIKSIKDKNPEINIELTGFCFGGMIAQYAALATDTRASCFNPLPLGPKLQKDLGKTNLKKGIGLITNISVKNDHISDLKLNIIGKVVGEDFPGMERLNKISLTKLDKIVNGLGIRTPGNFGDRYVMSLPVKSTNIPKNQHFDAHTHPMAALLNTAQLLTNKSTSNL